MTEFDSTQPLDPSRQRRAVERVFFEQGWENLDEIDDWDGTDLESLRGILTDEQYQTLMDELGGPDDDR
jgi:hypothetical protein